MALVFDRSTYAREGEKRMITLAMLASIVLHALLLYALPELRDAAQRNAMPPGPLVARLAPMRAAAALKPAIEKTPQPLLAPPPRPADSLRGTPGAEPRPAPAAVPAPAAIRAPSLAAQGNAPAGETARSAEPSAAPPSPAASNTPPAAAASSSPGLLAKLNPQLAPPAPSDSAEPVSLNQYRLTIISAAKRYKRYPRVAIDNNWEGRVVIRMVIGTNGFIASIGVKTGAGHDILDREAIEMIRKAKPLAPIPAALRGKEFAVEIPVEFSLKDEG